MLEINWFRGCSVLKRLYIRNGFHIKVKFCCNTVFYLVYVIIYYGIFVCVS